MQGAGDQNLREVSARRTQRGGGTLRSRSMKVKPTYRADVSRHVYPLSFCANGFQHSEQISFCLSDVHLIDGTLPKEGVAASRKWQPVVTLGHASRSMRQRESSERGSQSDRSGLGCVRTA